jgi:hypothetical protein
MYIHHLIIILIVIFVFYIIHMGISRRIRETFQNDSLADLNLSPVITENKCDPAEPSKEYSYQINRNYCFGNISCWNKDDICVNQHCVPQDVPPPVDDTRQCVGCSKPGL